MTYKPHPIRTVGGHDKLVSSDSDVLEALLELVQQLKIVNVHLEQITDATVGEADVDYGGRSR